jgi:hypothetical protein
VRNDSRASFLVEDGDRWAELRAVHLDCHAQVVTPSAELQERISVAMADKYSAHRTRLRDMPSATADVYRQSGAIIELAPAGKILTWDNRRIKGL